MLKKSKKILRNFGNWLKNKTGQEEMIGFALIIIIVAVVLLVFLGYSLKNPEFENVESYEIESFIQSFLQYTTDCADSYEPQYYSIEKLIIACERKEKCLDEQKTCDILKDDLENIIENSWQVYEDSPIKGYNLKISSRGDILLEFGEGNATNNYKSSLQELGKEDIEIIFNVYY
ncbi:MAG: hypothetical protein PVJ67_01360 [Candidatus Pacearchaeota archaeon]|jgi:hypothetical protein